MTGASGTGRSGKKYAYYRCRNHDIDNVPKDDLENWVVDEAVRFFSDDQEMAQIVNMLYYYMAQKNASERESRVPKSRLFDLRKQRDNLINVLAQRGNASLVDKLEEVEAELARLEAIDQEEQNRKTFTKEELEISIRLFFDPSRWPDPEQSKAQIIKALIKEVILYEDHAEIIFNIQIDLDDPDEGNKKIVRPNLTSLHQSDSLENLFLKEGFLAITKKRP